MKSSLNTILICPHCITLMFLSHCSSASTEAAITCTGETTAPLIVGITERLQLGLADACLLSMV